jgi:hypothetical protein
MVWMIFFIEDLLHTFGFKEVTSASVEKYGQWKTGRIDISLRTTAEN